MDMRGGPAVVRACSSESGKRGKVHSMGNPGFDQKDWERIASTLKACRDEERSRWGSCDDVTIARFVAGVCTPPEREQVRRWMQDFDAVRELVAFLDPSLAPLNSAASVTVGAAAAPGSIEKPHSGVGTERLWNKVRDGVMRLRANLVVQFDDVAQAIVPTSSSVVYGVMDEVPQERRWRLELSGSDVECSLRLHAPGRRQPWTLTVEGVRGTSTEATLSLARPDDEADFSVRLADWLNRPIPLAAGAWELLLEDGENRWIIPMTVTEETGP